MHRILTHDYEIPTWLRDVPAMQIPSMELLRTTTKDLNEAIQLYCHSMQTECKVQADVEFMEILQKYAETCSNAYFVIGIEEQNGNRWLEILFHRLDNNMIDQILMSEDGNEYTIYELNT